MNIAIHVRLLVKHKIEGIGRFTLEAVSRLCKQHPEHTFYLIFDRMYEPEYIFSPNVKPIIVPFQARHPFLWWFWFHVQLPRVLKALNPDVFVSTDGFLPIPASVPTLNIIHDLNFEHNPLHLPRLVRWYYTKFFPLYASSATRLATVSEYSKQDISSLYGIQADAIDVVYNGISSEFVPLSDYEKKLVKARVTQGEDYFVYVGSLHPRKNVQRLIEAFSLFKAKSQSPIKLVLVGAEMFLSHDIKKAYHASAYSADILFTGRVASQELAELVGAAFALAFVPLFEGFGIPIIEAFACKVPVVASSCTSLPEVAGNAALYCDALSISSIADALTTIATDTAIYEELIAAAEERAKLFSWDNTAELLWTSIQKTISIRQEE